MYSGGTFSIHELASAHVAGDQRLSFALLMLAVLLRKGVFPFHFWFPVAAERGPWLKNILFFNAHLGAFLVARIALPSMPGASHEGLGPLFDLALVTSGVTALMALVEQNPRRLLALLAVSHGSFILSGLETGTLEGFTGAMIYWIVVAVATTVIFLVLRLLEVRTGGDFPLDRFHGLGARAPRFAVFFAVSALALVGLPGTLGFWAEDLLLQGALTSHPQLGLILPAATALNAVTLLRAFARLFLGRRAWRVPALSDALPRERWVLALGVVIVVLLGIAPGGLAGFISTRISQPAQAHEATALRVNGW
jgi:NADH-quinone oxidoreductase subunit M